jgi:general secretion pathway protein E/type IV pilus assembly protein PilB
VPDDFPIEKLQDGATLYRAVGCRECRQVGYLGRVGIFELLVTTEKVRQLTHDRASTWTVGQEAIREGMRTLRIDGWRKVLSGRTTIDEVVRVTKGNTLEMTMEEG